MDFLSSILAAIGGFFAGFVGHVTAHDFCAAIPKWSKKLVVSAASRLAPNDRERYQEEWLADLEERPTVIAKLRHALGCFVCARTMRRQSAPQKSNVKVRLEFVGSGVVEVDGNSALLFFKAWTLAQQFGLGLHYVPRFARTPLERFATPIVKALFRYHRRRAGAVDLESVGRSLELIASNKTTAFRGYIDGELFADIDQGKLPRSAD